MDLSSTASRTTIDDLVVATLVAIFERLPLVKQVHIDEVCRKWSEQKSFTLSKRKQLSICEDAKKLHLFVTTTDAELFLAVMSSSSALDKHRDRLALHALYAKLIPPKMVDNITKLMPNLTVIRIQQGGKSNELWKIKLLLNRYRCQLVEVNIVFDGIFNAAQDQLEKSKKNFRDMFLSLITTLNSLEKLDILVLWLRLPKNCASSIEVDLSVARRLKVLSVCIDCLDVDLLAHTYQTYAEENESLQQLCCVNKFRLNTLLAFNLRVLASVREVRLKDILDTEQIEAFKQFARQCPNLEFLYLDVSNLPMAQVAKALLPCKALVWLQVDFHINDGDDPVVLENGLPIDQLPVLSTVKFLELSITTTSHRDLEKMNLEIIFPNVQVVKLHHRFNRCQVCNFSIPPNIAQSSRSAQAVYSFLIHECQRLTRPHFAKFSKLTKLTADIGQEEISSSFKKEVDFLLNALNQETYEVSGKFIEIK